MYALLAVMLMASPEVPTTPQSVTPSAITNPDWVRRPTASDLAKYYPMAAARAEIEGRATIFCNVTKEGALAGCAVVSEEPVGVGFGDAALAMSGIFKMRPVTRGGVPVEGGTVRIPIRFGLPKGPAKPAPTLEVASRCYASVAAKLEQNPNELSSRVTFFAFRMLIELKLAGQNLKPSELDARLASLRAKAELDLKAAHPPVEREACDAFASTINTEAFEQMVKETADRP